MGWTSVLRRVALIAAMLGGLGAGGQWASAQTTPSTSAPAAPAPAAPSNSAPSAPAPAAPSTPAPAAPSSAGGSGATTPTSPPAPSTEAAPGSNVTAPSDKTSPADKTVPDTSISQTIELQPRPAIMLNGQSTWDEGFKTLNDSFTKLNDTLNKNNIRSAGSPMAVFTETDDAGFKFSAMIPIETAPEGKPNVPADVSFGTSPGGKVMRFQHRSAYDDIDSTYEAITAYLDEKGLEAKNMFAEEYLNRTKSSDDPSLEVDIDVFLK